MASGKEGSSARARPSDATASGGKEGKEGDGGVGAAGLGMRLDDGLMHALEPSVDAKLSTLMFNFLALPESAELVDSLVRDFKEGRPLNAPPIPMHLDAPMLAVGALDAAAGAVGGRRDPGGAAGKSSTATLGATASAFSRLDAGAARGEGRADEVAGERAKLLATGKVTSVGNTQSPPRSPRHRKKQQLSG